MKKPKICMGAVRVAKKKVMQIESLKSQKKSKLLYGS
jgi:hypothetical protein